MSAKTDRERERFADDTDKWAGPAGIIAIIALGLAPIVLLAEWAISLIYRMRYSPMRRSMRPSRSSRRPIAREPA